MINFKVINQIPFDENYRNKQMKYREQGKNGLCALMIALIETLYNAQSLDILISFLNENKCQLSIYHMIQELQQTKNIEKFFGFVKKQQVEELNQFITKKMQLMDAIKVIQTHFPINILFDDNRQIKDLQGQGNSLQLTLLKRNDDFFSLLSNNQIQSITQMQPTLEMEIEHKLFCSKCKKNTQELFQNSNCSHSFCFECINNWSNGNLCQICLNKFNLKDAYQHFKIQPQLTFPKNTDKSFLSLQCSKCNEIQKSINELFQNTSCIHKFCYNCIQQNGTNQLAMKSNQNKCFYLNCSQQLNLGSAFEFFQIDPFIFFGQQIFDQFIEQYFKCSQCQSKNYKKISISFCGHPFCENCNYNRNCQVCSKQLQNNTLMTLTISKAENCINCQSKNYLIGTSLCGHSFCKQCLPLKTCSICCNFDLTETIKYIYHEISTLSNSENQLKKNLICSLCMKNDPYIKNSCGHQYCLQCIKNNDSANLCFYYNCHLKLDEEIILLIKNHCPQLSLNSCVKCGIENNIVFINDCKHAYCKNCIIKYKISFCIFKQNCSIQKFDEWMLNQFLNQEQDPCQICTYKRPKFLLFENKSCRHKICFRCLQKKQQKCSCFKPLLMQSELIQLQKLCMICQHVKTNVFQNTCFHQYCIDCIQQNLQKNSNYCFFYDCFTNLNTSQIYQFQLQFNSTYNSHQNGKQKQLEEEFICYKCSNVYRKINDLFECQNCRYILCSNCNQEILLDNFRSKSSIINQHQCMIKQICLQKCEQECFCPQMFYCCCFSEIDQFSQINRQNPKCNSHFICALCFFSDQPFYCHFTSNKRILPGKLIKQFQLIEKNIRQLKINSLSTFSYIEEEKYSKY